MDGYSVSEAASVLGVPIERVWELLARGVLAGTPEGETGMRVFLQPRPRPEAPVEVSAPRGNGSPEPEREISPFRELLTEFRNLTERYGQALLALGESRGEVAALRSRVDLLEARIDHGLPGLSTTARPRSWWPGAGPMPPDEGLVAAEPPPVEAADAQDEPPERAAVAEPPSATVPEPSESEEPTGDHEEHRSRPRGPRLATESFAEAIARAQDPSLPDLPAEPMPQPIAAEANPVTLEAPDPAEAARASDPAEATEVAEVAEPPPPPTVVEESSPAEPLEWDSERYTTDIEEPDWFEAEAEENPVSVPAVPAETDAVARDEPSEDFPGARDLRSALEALGVAPGEAASLPVEPETAPAPESVVTHEPPRGAPPVPESALRYRPVAPAGPTGRAYRRLRRIFPG